MSGRCSAGRRSALAHKLMFHLEGSYPQDTLVNFERIPWSTCVWACNARCSTQAPYGPRTMREWQGSRPGWLAHSYAEILCQTILTPSPWGCLDGSQACRCGSSRVARAPCSSPLPLLVSLTSKSNARTISRAGSQSYSLIALHQGNAAAPEPQVKCRGTWTCPSRWQERLPHQHASQKAMPRLLHCVCTLLT